MISDIFGNPDGINLQAAPAFHPELGYWVVQFSFGGKKAFWQVDFTEQTNPEQDIHLRIQMRNLAIDMFTDVVAERLKP